MNKSVWYTDTWHITDYGYKIGFDNGPFWLSKDEYIYMERHCGWSTDYCHSINETYLDIIDGCKYLSTIDPCLKEYNP